MADIVDGSELESTSKLTKCLRVNLPTINRAESEYREVVIVCYALIKQWMSNYLPAVVHKATFTCCVGILL